ncbi:chlorophyllase [Nocardia sp. NEAU-G5]|uniref:Chlorophyllase n=1 Tax=Nocardia albiluteola TaxID=2842303 RepID=A0ABS6BD24_9NOCA|nr:chlorophyllase [Nocardia albiluteola]MBU3067636.1 chlorophyllase [Nocardia albiluteola]
MSTPFTEAAGFPIATASTPVIAFAPVVLPVPGRTVDLRVKVSAPATGSDLPVMLLSHGHGPSNFVSSLHGYGPVADFWAAHGFVVIQPTHLDAMMLGLREADDPDAPLYWRSRARDMHHILDHLDLIEAAVPGLSGRLNHDRIAAVGHSMGGHTVGLLCGQQVTVEGTPVDLADARVKAGVLMAPAGGGQDVSAFAAEHYPVLRATSFATMTTPALVIVGDNDWSPRFSERKDWRSDAYFHSPGPKSLLTLFGAEHGLGGVSGYDAKETTDENPERVAALRALTWAYLRSTLYPGDSAWADAIAALRDMPEPLGRIESK